jgi:phosphopantetheinyl transferase
MTATGTTGWRIETEPNGRPRARHVDSTHRCDLSIAHSGTIVAAAVCGRGSVGVDIEWHKPGRDHRGIARLTFGPQERRMAERGGIHSFYRLWTLREAISKATGLGLAMVMDGVDRLPAEPHTGHWLSSDRQWLLAHLEPRPSLSFALAMRKDAPGEACDWSPEALRWYSEPEVDACLRPPDDPLGQGRQPKARTPM